MGTFDQIMGGGQAQYQDVIDALAAAGYSATFTQTGGMNAALEVMLEGGWALLITDSDDSLSWSRGGQRGWGVGLFHPDERYDSAPQSFENSDDSGTQTVLGLVAAVLRAAVVVPAGRTGTGEGLSKRMPDLRS